MAYTVLARKYRSRTFDEVVGQESITTTLRNAITTKRVHHGYLFCGTRGVGKTSMARILAKALNCLAADEPTGSPCGTCEACKGIAEGNDLDVIEIDAASNTSVDNIRDLRSNAVLSPARCRYKIYIIDEVHMLSKGAFNALLKTLEEPPSHVKFILATTDPQKVPATIQSRVQRFDFRPLTVDEIADQITRICGDEGVKAEPAAIRRIARLAAGSMRDGLSLLDQVLSLCGDDLTAEKLDAVLPVAYDELTADLIDRLADADASGALRAVERCLGSGEALEQWCQRLIDQLRDLMVLRICGAETDLVDVPAGLRERLAEQSVRFDEGTYVLMITVLEELRRAVRYSASGRALIEAAVVRLAEAPKFTSIESLLARLGSSAEPAARPAAAAAPADKKKAPPTGVAPSDRSKPQAPGLKPPPPRPTPQTARAAAPRTKREDMQAAHAEPMVRRAMEVFNGQLVGIVRHGGGPGMVAPSRDHATQRGHATQPSENDATQET
jgi:DNA polymerase-3 subunit gamma/tau